MLLYRYLLNSQVGSRRKISSFIKSGQVKVNDKIVKNPTVEINTTKDRVLLNNKPVMLMAEEKEYILLNKPAGFICTLEDRHAKKKVMDIIDSQQRLYPIGRLDKNTRGLLLLTNDGELANRLMHPSYEVEKVYRAFVKPMFKKSDIRRFEQGVVLDDEEKVAAKVNSVVDDRKERGSIVELTIHQGLKRQIRRMFSALEYKVHDLIRIRVGNITLSGLEEGKYRKLTPKEIHELKIIVGIRK
jgi:23S rRNA pseudouridine2605 synthase